MRTSRFKLDTHTKTSFFDFILYNTLRKITRIRVSSSLHFPVLTHRVYDSILIQKNTGQSRNSEKPCSGQFYAVTTTCIGTKSLCMNKWNLGFFMQ